MSKGEKIISRQWVLRIIENRRGKGNQAPDTEVVAPQPSHCFSDTVELDYLLF